MTVTGDDALVGRVLDDRYLIGARIARGGMASVFRATDQRLDREVALKVMHTGLGDDGQFTDRFVREARAAAKLNHRNVVSVFDQGRDGDITYLVMEYVPGRTLRDVMRDEAPMETGHGLGVMGLERLATTEDRQSVGMVRAGLAQQALQGGRDRSRGNTGAFSDSR